VKPPRPRALVFFALAVLAALLRFAGLAARPMHADESVHADKLGSLLEGRGYAYDPAEYHGPTLYYLTLAPAWIAGERRYVDLDEATLRSVPALAGTLLVVAHVLARPLLGTAGAWLAALLAAISPAMVYYSRYYIHEVLLVAASFGALLCLCRYLRRPGAVTALAAGGFAGLMLATKETAPIALACMLLALPVAGRDRSAQPAAPALARDALLAAFAACVVAALFFSSFLRHPSGVLDAAHAYGHYLERATAASPHVHPWHYYLGLLAHFPASDAPLWTEAAILVLAACGAVSAWTSQGASGADRPLLRFVAVYTGLMVVAYSAIPYKTPWCLLGFLHGMILLAGAGGAWLVSRVHGSWRALPAAAVAAVSAHLLWQAWAASFRFAADPRNPYVYAHTSTDVLEIVARLTGLAESHPAGRAMPIQVVTRQNPWPLPWYFRRLTGVEWWTGVSDTARVAPVVVVTPDLEPALVRRLYEVPPPGERELYVGVFERQMELRPGVELRAYASAALSEAWKRRESGAHEAAAGGR
jgi:uncharacterized protein (TIGR03663 family)